MPCVRPARATPVPSPGVALMTEPTVRDYEAVLHRVYAGDPRFVHPDVALLTRVLSGRAVYLRHGRARAFCVPGEAFAVAFVDPRVQDKHGAAIGSIGYLEARNQDGALEVLGPAIKWLGSEDVAEVWAPFNGNP